MTQDRRRKEEVYIGASSVKMLLVGKRHWKMHCAFRGESTVYVEPDDDAPRQCGIVGRATNHLDLESITAFNNSLKKL